MFPKQGFWQVGDAKLYHLYVSEKVRNGLEVADLQDSVPQEKVEQRFGKWLTE